MTTIDEMSTRAHDAAPPTRQARSRGDSYLALWRRTPRALLFLLPTLPIVTVAFSVLLTLLTAGIATAIIYIGVFLVIAALVTARSFGTLELVRLRAAGFPEIEPPRWKLPAPGANRWRRLLTPLADGHHWLYLLHGMVVNFAIGLATWIIAVTWVTTALGGVTYWFWSRFLPEDDFSVAGWLHDVLFGGVLPVAPSVAESILYFVFGLLLLVSLPVVLHGLVRLHHAVARGMLGAWRSEALERRVVDLDASRGAAVAAEDQALRRLERDLHDGPQQRLVRLQMDLAAAERRLDADPEAVRLLLSEARAQSRDALEELRALSRGFAPPILLDRGLVAAIESLAARSPLPMKLATQLEGRELPPEIERNAYFIVSELVTNAAKHSQASEVRVALALDITGGARDLRIRVEDDGVGGAVVVDGHGLDGLHDRVRGLDGQLGVESPRGGPTLVTAVLPVA